VDSRSLASLGLVPAHPAVEMLLLLILGLALGSMLRDKAKHVVSCIIAASRAQEDLEIKPVKRLRLPSIWWRFATIMALAILITNDPSLDRMWTANAQCSIPSNASTLTTRITDFAYDLDGHLTQVNCPEGVINYGYDLATGRHTSTCTANSYMTYGYDELGRLKTVTLSKRNGQSITPETTTYTYDKVGNRSTMTLPNNIVSIWQYDSLNRLTNLTQVVGTTNQASYAYKLDLTGRRTNAVEILLQEGGTYLTNTLTWEYDGMYRLTNEVSISSSSGGNYTNAFQYDLVGNRYRAIKTASGNITTVTNAYDGNDRLLREVTQVNTTLTDTNNYAYDANGSLTGKTNASGVVTYAYNLANKLSSVTGPGGTASYQYNDQGIRVRANGDSTKYYLVDEHNQTGYAQVLEELNTVGGTPSVSYVLGDDALGQCGSDANDPRWRLVDGHGSTRQLADKNATVKSHYNYEAYGLTMSTSTASAETSTLYCGEQYDSTLQMYNLRARFYNPSNGRFNQRDPFAGISSDPQSLHKYTYANCDSVNGIDPSGRYSMIEVMAVILILSVLVMVASTLIKLQHHIRNGESEREIDVMFEEDEVSSNGAEQIILGSRGLAFANERLEKLTEKVENVKTATRFLVLIQWMRQLKVIEDESRVRNLAAACKIAGKSEEDMNLYILPDIYPGRKWKELTEEETEHVGAVLINSGAEEGLKEFTDRVEQLIEDGAKLTYY
jgi:RHS repeat-associated protein